MEKVYIQAILALLNSGLANETVLANTKSVMATRGHAKALPAVLQGVLRALEEVSDITVPVVTVAKASDVTALAADIAAATATLGTATKPTIVVDEAIIGGLIATYNHRQLDESYRSKLLSVYQNVTKS